MRLAFLLLVIIAITSCTSTFCPQRNYTKRTVDIKPPHKPISTTPFKVDTTKKVVEMRQEVAPLPAWEDDTFVCDIEEIPAFDYIALSNCIQQAMNQREYSLALELLQLTPNRNQEKKLLKQRVALAYYLEQDTTSNSYGLHLQSNLEMRKVHYLELSESIKVQTELINADSNELKQKWQALIHKLERTFFMKARYPVLAKLVENMGGKAPTESLQKSVHAILNKSLRRDRAQAQSILTEIQQLIQYQSDFSTARDKLLTLETQYRHIEEGDQYNALRVIITQKEQEFHSKSESKNVDSLYAIANTFEETGEYIKSRDVYRSLLKTKFVNESKAALKNVADKYCTERRVMASKDFKESFKHKGTATESKLLKSALDQLTNCLDEFPESSQTAVITKNRDLLLEKIGE